MVNTFIFCIALGAVISFLFSCKFLLDSLDTRTKITSLLLAIFNFSIFSFIGGLLVSIIFMLVSGGGTSSGIVIVGMIGVIVKYGPAAFLSTLLLEILLIIIAPSTRISNQVLSGLVLATSVLITIVYLLVGPGERNSSPVNIQSITEEVTRP